MPRVDLPEPYAIRQARQSVRDSNVCPPLAASDTADRLEADPSHLRKFGQSAVAGADHQHVSLSQFGVGVPLAGGVTIPHDHVGHVFGLGSQPKVCRLNANGLVAGVQDKETFRNVTVVDFVGSSGRNHIPAVDGQDSVAVGINGTSPIPATFGCRAGHHPSENFGFGVEAARTILLDRPAVQHITMPAPACVVSLAPAPAGLVVVAVLDGAGGCHDKT